MCDGFTGWTLEQATCRVPDLVMHLAAGDLLGWGRRGDPRSESLPLPESAWSEAILPAAGSTKKYDALLAGAQIFDLRIFPVLEAPNAVQHIKEIPLNEMFRRFVRGDAEVQHLAKAAIAAAPDLSRIYEGEPKGMLGFWPVDETMLVDIGEYEHVIQDYIRGYVWNDDTIKAQAVLRSRLRAMTKLLTSGQMVAVGDPVRPNDSGEILRTIWGSSSYHFEERSGDLYQDKDWGDGEVDADRWPDGREIYDLRWRAVLLKPALPGTRVVGRPQSVSPPRRRQIEKYRSCLSFLSEEMRKSPSKRPKTRAAYLREAKELIPGLGEPTFNDAWEEAKRRIPEAASAWSAPGAPRKSG